MKKLSCMESRRWYHLKAPSPVPKNSTRAATFPHLKRSENIHTWRLAESSVRKVMTVKYSLKSRSQPHSPYVRCVPSSNILHFRQQGFKTHQIRLVQGGPSPRGFGLSAIYRQGNLALGNTVEFSAGLVGNVKPHPYNRKNIWHCTLAELHHTSLLLLRSITAEIQLNHKYKQFCQMFLRGTSPRIWVK